MPSEVHVAAPIETIGSARFGITTTVKSVALAHCPGSGVNVYVVVTVLSNAGDQLPLTPLLLVLDNVKESPLQISEIGSNKGVVGAGPLTVIVADETQPFASVTVTVYVPSVKFEILYFSKSVH